MPTLAAYEATRTSLTSISLAFRRRLSSAGSLLLVSLSSSGDDRSLSDPREDCVSSSESISSSSSSIGAPSAPRRSVCWPVGRPVGPGPGGCPAGVVLAVLPGGAALSGRPGGGGGDRLNSSPSKVSSVVAPSITAFISWSTAASSSPSSGFSAASDLFSAAATAAVLALCPLIPIKTTSFRLSSSDGGCVSVSTPESVRCSSPRWTASASPFVPCVSRYFTGKVSAVLYMSIVVVSVSSGRLLASLSTSVVVTSISSGVVNSVGAASNSSGTVTFAGAKVTSCVNVSPAESGRSCCPIHESEAEAGSRSAPVAPSHVSAGVSVCGRG